MIQVLPHKRTHVTKAVYYLSYVDVLVRDSVSKLQFKCTNKKKKLSSRVGDLLCTVLPRIV